MRGCWRRGRMWRWWRRRCIGLLRLPEWPTGMLAEGVVEHVGGVSSSQTRYYEDYTIFRRGEDRVVLVVAGLRAAHAADVADQRVAVAVVAAFADQRQAHRLADLPVQACIGHVLGRVAGDRQALAGAAGLLALGPGVVAAQLQVVQKIHLRSRFDAAGFGLVDVHALAEGRSPARPSRADVHAVAAIVRGDFAVGEGTAAGDLVFEIVEEPVRLKLLLIRLRPVRGDFAS